MNTSSKLLVAATLLATLSMSAVPAMAAGAAKQAAVKSDDIPLLMPPIVIIGKRLTAEEKAMYAAQDRAQNMKKIARKKNATTALSAL